MAIKRRKPPMAIKGTQPLAVNKINGEWRIALVNPEKDLFGEYHTVIRWYLPRTRRHRNIINNHIDQLERAQP